MVAPHVAIMTLQFQVYGCESLRDKKRAFSAMRQVWGKEPDLAVAEVADHDDLSLATWAVVTTGSSVDRLQQRLQAVEQEILKRIDAPILDTRFEIT